MADSSNKAQLRIGVVGMGPIGTVLAAYFVDAGMFVVPCDIDREKIDLVKNEGIALENIFDKKVSVKQVCYSIDELREYDLDLVVLATKASANDVVATAVSNIVSEKAFVLCAQNGLDNEQDIAAVLGEDRTLRMVVNYAGGMSARNVMHAIFFNAPNYVAALSQNGNDMASTVAHTLSEIGLATEVPEDIRKYTWEKVILNAALAPVCAVSGLTMRAVMEAPEGLSLVSAILDESIKVAEADGVSYGTDFKEFCMKYLSQGGYHKPSMLVDLENGARTEIDLMNGRIAEYGRKHGLPVPINGTITAMVHLAERNKK